jgi:hypothetical protein
LQSLEIANFVKEERRSNNDQIEQNGNKLEAKSDIMWDQNLDMFLRRGARFSQFRHFTMKQYILWNQKVYADFLISSISNTK